MSRGSTAPHSSRIRSASVRLAVVDVGDDRQRPEPLQRGSGSVGAGRHGSDSRRGPPQPRYTPPSASPVCGAAPAAGNLSGSLEKSGSPTPRGEHQEPEEAEHPERDAPSAQQGHALRAEDPGQGRRQGRRRRRRGRRRRRCASPRSASTRPAAKGRIHKNAASRRTSRLMKRGEPGRRVALPAPRPGAPRPGARRPGSCRPRCPRRLASRGRQGREPRDQHLHTDLGRDRPRPLDVEVGLEQRVERVADAGRARARATARAPCEPGTA